TDVPSHLGAERAVVVRGGEAAVDLRGGEHESSTLRERDQRLKVSLHARRRLRGIGQTMLPACVSEMCSARRRALRSNGDRGRRRGRERNIGLGHPQRAARRADRGRLTPDGTGSLYLRTIGPDERGVFVKLYAAMVVGIAL